MAVIDKELQRKHATEERLLRFAEFVEEQKAKNSRGMNRVCLQSEGYRDFYGKVSFGVGMHRSLWILPMEENPKALLFSEKIEAKEYAQKIQKILREKGYLYSKAWVEPVAARISTPHPYFGSILPTITYEERYIILMRVR